MHKKYSVSVGIYRLSHFKWRPQISLEYCI